MKNLNNWWQKALLTLLLCAWMRETHALNPALWHAVRVDTLLTNVQDVTWGPPGYLALANSGKVVFSSDGEQWQAGESLPAAGNVLFGAGAYVATGTNIFHSATGTGWQQVPKRHANANSTMAYGNGMFACFVPAVSFGDYSYAQLSYDGANWLGAGSAGVGSSRRFPVLYDRERFVVLDRDTTRVLQRIYLIPEHESSFDSLTNNLKFEPLDFVFGKGVYVAVGANGLMATSTNLQKWSPVNRAVSANLSGIAYGAGYFIAAGEANTLLYSTNAAMWTKVAPPVPDSWTKVLFGKDRFVAIGAKGNIIATDPLPAERVNRPPRLMNLPDEVSVNEREELVLSPQADDPDGDTVRLSVQFGELAHTQADPFTGQFRWQAPEWPRDYSITIRARDSGTPPFEVSQTIAIHVRKYNSPPEVPIMMDRVVFGPLDLQLSIFDRDEPSQQISARLKEGPSGAVLDGEFNLSWTPAEADFNRKHRFAIQAWDDGTPPRTNETSFEVSLLTPPADLPLSKLEYNGPFPTRFAGSGFFQSDGELIVLGAMLRTRDGTNWTQLNVPVRLGLVSMAKLGDRYIGTVYDGWLMRSPDLTNWSRVPIDAKFVGIAAGNGLFAAITAEGILHTSPDGLSWTRQNLGAPLESIAFGNGVFAVAGGTAIAPEDAFTIFTSKDGLEWHRQDVGKRPPGLSVSIKYSEGEFFATSGLTLLSSTDGTEWLTQTTPFFIYSIIRAGGIYVAASGSEIYTSSDKVAWKGPVGRTPGIGINALVHFNDLFVASGWPTALLVTPDFKSWRNIIDGPTFPIVDIAHGNGMFLALSKEDGNRPGEFTMSVDGQHWRSLKGPTGFAAGRLWFAEGAFLLQATPMAWTNVLMASTNGVVWSPVYPGPDNPPRIRLNGVSVQLDPKVWAEMRFFGRVAFGNGIFIGARGGLSYSVNGSDWSPIFAPQGIYRDIVFAKDRFIAVGYAGIIATSRDGRDWDARHWDTKREFSFVRYFPPLIVAGGDGILVTSLDGEHWVENARPSDHWLTAAAIDGNRVVFGGHGGELLSSTFSAALPLHFGPLAKQSNGEFRAQFTPHKEWVIESSPDLLNWTQDETHPASSDTFAKPLLGPQRFFRVRQ